MMDQLTAFPSAAKLYSEYWSKKPFLVKGWLAAADLAELVPRDELIAMATRPAIDSKVVAAPPLAAKEQSWAVEEGPFEPEIAQRLSQPRQSLLVQGVDLHHLATAKLWQRVAAAPLWLRDNIMASLSTHGGTVGPHLDSYHVFLLQGQGKRQWRVADADSTADGQVPKLIDGLPLKILAEDFEGEAVVCEPGDLLYVPPGFGHHGVSIETSITYSLGFLGPDTAELWQSYSEYLDVIGDSEDGRIKGRYRGERLSRDDSGFRISPDTIASFRQRMAAALNHPLFHDWLGEYFSTGHYPDTDQDWDGEASDQDESYARAGAFMDKVLAGSDGLTTVFPFKVAITSNAAGQLSYQVAGLAVQLTVSEWQVIHALIQMEPVSKTQLRDSLDPAKPESDLWPLLLHLWEEGFLAFR